MLKILAKIFIKNKEDIDNPIVRKHYGMLCGIYGIITNILIASGKIIFGLLVTSIAILADGINNLMDGASSIITIISFKLSATPPDSEHPYGHQRMEYIGGLIVSFAMFSVGILFLDSSIRKIISPIPLDLEHFFFLAIIMIISIILKISQWQLYKQASKLLDSTGLLASSKDSFGDILISSTVLFSLLLFFLFGINVDGIAGLLVAIVIIFHAIVLIKETISLLLGEAPKKEYIQKIKALLLTYPGVLGIHDLLIHSYGPNKTFITVHVEVDSNIDILISHDQMDKIEYDFLENHNINLLIHMDPINKNDKETLELENEVQKIIKTLDERLCIHDFRITKGQITTKIIFDVVVPPHFNLSDGELKEKIITKIKQLNKKYIIIITIDHHYFT